MMDKKRIVFLELASEINCCICTFCKYAEWEAGGCCEGYHMCAHPIEKLCEQKEEIEPGDDCWGFQPCHPVNVCADIVGAILSQGFNEWAIRPYSRKAVTVYGRDDDRKESRVRIGHDGGITP